MTNDAEKLIKQIRSDSLKATIIICVCIAAAAVVICSLRFDIYVVVFAAALVLYFLISGISSTVKCTSIIKNNPAVECTVEDYIIRKDGGRFSLSPVLRNTVTGELLYTFGKYDKSFLIKAYGKKPDALNEMSITRINHTGVEIGDAVRVYIKRFIEYEIFIEKGTDYYYLDNENRVFRNLNPEHDISILKELKIFEGVIDVEKYIN